MKKLQTSGNSYNVFAKSRKNAILLIILLANMICVAAMAQSVDHISPLSPGGSVPSSIYDFKVPALNGGTIDFAQFKGKKILIVNTKSLAGNDIQFAHLEALHQKYKDKLVIIGFPDDDFGEHPSALSESYFKKANYNVTFLMAAKAGVKGVNRAPVYVWLTEKKYNHFMDSEIKWDFQKYLINEKGQLVAEFDPKIKATGSKISAAVEK
jgi:glutathione peroxidase